MRVGTYQEAVSVFVLVHGGGFAASCWDPVLPYLEGDVLAVDLPGRGEHPADLESVTFADWAASVVSDIEKRAPSGSADVVLVGHSLAGLTLPRVLDLIPDRISRVVFVSCSFPLQDQPLLEVLAESFDERISARAAESASGEAPTAQSEQGMSEELAREMFCNDMTEEQAVATFAMMVPESSAVMSEPVDMRGIHQPMPKTWVRLTQDAILRPHVQDKFIAEIGDIDVVDLDAGHMVMISRPRALAAVLNKFA